MVSAQRYEDGSEDPKENLPNPPDQTETAEGLVHSETEVTLVLRTRFPGSTRGKRSEMKIVKRRIYKKSNKASSRSRRRSDRGRGDRSDRSSFERMNTMSSLNMNLLDNRIQILERDISKATSRCMELQQKINVTNAQNDVLRALRDIIQAD